MLRVWKGMPLNNLLPGLSAPNPMHCFFPGLRLSWIVRLDPKYMGSLSFDMTVGFIKGTIPWNGGPMLMHFDTLLGMTAG